jgi:hypothetical protein
MYQVQHYAYCGMSGIPQTFDTLTDARIYIAGRLRRYRRRYPVVTLEAGSAWEVCEPEDCAMVPDACGTLSLRHVTHDCRECGRACESADDALACCYVSDDWSE